MLNILIVEQTGNTYKLHLVKPRHDIGSSILHRTLILHKKNDHYDAIVPSSQSAYVTTPPCSARTLVSHASPNQDNASIISTMESIAWKSRADNDVECNTINSHVRDDEKRLNDNCIFKEVKQFYLNNKNNFKMAHINVNSKKVVFAINSNHSGKSYLYKKANCTTRSQMLNSMSLCINVTETIISVTVFCLGRFCRARRPAPFW